MARPQNPKHTARWRNRVITIDQVMVAQDPIASSVFKASKEEKLGATDIFKGWTTAELWEFVDHVNLAHGHPQKKRRRTKKAVKNLSSDKCSSGKPLAQTTAVSSSINKIKRKSAETRAQAPKPADQVEMIRGKEANKVVLQPGEIDDEGTLVVDSTETGRVKLMEPLYLKDGPSYILKVYAGSDAKRGQVRLLDPKRQNDTKLKYTYSSYKFLITVTEFNRLAAEAQKAEGVEGKCLRGGKRVR